jgi:hypothetical protein
MNRTLAEKLIKDYLYSWIKEDLNLLLDTLDDKIFISECYGPIYKSKKEIENWFTDWCLNENKVTKFESLLIIYDKEHNSACVEWDFECYCNGEVGSFFGTSLIEFNENKIISLKEFKSEKERYQPYEKATTEYTGKTSCSL